MYIFQDEIFFRKDSNAYFTSQYAKNCLSSEIKKDDSNESDNSFLLIQTDGHEVPIEKVDKYKLFFDEQYNETTVLCTYNQYFSNADNMILCNELLGKELDQVNGEMEDPDGNPIDIYQSWIIDNLLSEFLVEHTHEYVAYYEPLDIHVLGVSHWGTSWDYVGAEYIT